MATKNKKPAPSANTNKSGGSYKEKQPLVKQQSGSKKDIPVDEDGDGKSDHSENPKKAGTKKEN